MTFYENSIFLFCKQNKKYIYCILYLSADYRILSGEPALPDSDAAFKTAVLCQIPPVLKISFVKFLNTFFFWLCTEHKLIFAESLRPASVSGLPRYYSGAYGVLSCSVSHFFSGIFIIFFILCLDNECLVCYNVT